MTLEEGKAMFERAVQRLPGMSGEEFLLRSLRAPVPAMLFCLHE